MRILSIRNDSLLFHNFTNRCGFKSPLPSFLHIICGERNWSRIIKMLLSCFWKKDKDNSSIKPDTFIFIKENSTFNRNNSIKIRNFRINIKGSIYSPSSACSSTGCSPTPESALKPITSHSE